MRVEISKNEKSTISLEIEVDAEKFTEGLQKSYKINVKKFAIPGFRKGKAPKSVVEKYYGEHVFYEDAINIVCSEAYEKAIVDNSIYPIDKPSIEITQIESGKPLIFKATVAVRPEVGLGEYKGIKVNKVEEKKVSEKDLEEELNKIAKNYARMSTVEDRGIEVGDVVNMDITRVIDGVPADEPFVRNHEDEIGSGKLLKDIEDALIGASADDEIDVEVNYPSDYFNPELAGTQASYKVLVNEVMSVELPEIDDEFAKDVSEFDTLEEYKDSLMEKLKEESLDTAKRELKKAVIDNVVENTPVDIPKVMLNDYLDRYLFGHQAHHMSEEKLEKVHKEFEEKYGYMAEDFYNKAKKEVSTQLILEKISEVENIEVTEEDVQNELQKIAEKRNTTIDALRKQYGEDGLNGLRFNLKLDKAVDILVENAKIT